MRRIQFTSNFFIRLLVLSCILGIFPLILVGYLSYNKSASIVQQEVTQGNLLILQQNRAEVEYLLRTTETLTVQIIQAPLTTNAISMASVLQLPHTSEHREIFENLLNRLVQIQLFELGISEVNLMSFRQNWLVDRNLVRSLDSLNPELEQNAYIIRLRNHLMQYQDVTELSYWSLFKNLKDESEYVIKLVKYIPVNSINPVGVITVNIPVREISKRLPRDERLGTVMITDAHGRIISHPNKSQIGNNLSGQEYFQKIVDPMRDNNYFTEIIGDMEYAVIYDQSDYNGWIYISLIPLESIIEKSNAIKWYTFIVCMIIVLVVVLFSTFVSHRMYFSIRTIHQLIAPASTSSEKTGDALNFIREQVRGMLQTQNRMVGQIEDLNRQAREYFVVKIMQGEIKPAEIEGQLENYGFFMDWDHWCIFAIQIDTLEHTRYTNEDKDLLLFAIHNIVEEIVPNTQRLSPVVISRSIFTLIGKSLDDIKPFKVEMFSVVEEIQKRVKLHLDLKISIGISRIHESLRLAPLAYQESLDALTYRIRLGQESILFLDEVHPEKRKHFKYPKEMESLLVEAVKQQDTEQAKLVLDQIISELLQKNVNHYDYQIFLGRLFNNLTGIVQDEGGSVHEVFQKDTNWMDELLKITSSSEIKIWFEQQIVVPLIRWLEKQRKSREINISEEILKMIREEYDKDLTIEICASRLNFHPSYISRVFKKEVGVTFSHYLSQYRVNIAKKWLKGTDMKVSEIANKLRYSNSSNFNRNFRKLENMTPTQYRERNM